jgi:putative sterol carrier protein
MVQYLSDEWLQEAGAALAKDPTLAAAAADLDLTIQYEVSGGPGGARAYGIRFDHGSSGIEPGKHDDAPVSFTLDYDTAAAIAKGDLSAQSAFMQGRLKLGGDVGVLIRQHAAFDGLDDALAPLRATTEY